MISSSGVSFLFIFFHSYKLRGAKEQNEDTILQSAVRIRMPSPVSYSAPGSVGFRLNLLRWVHSWVSGCVSLFGVTMGPFALPTEKSQEKFFKCCSLVPSVSSAFGNSWQQRRKSSGRSLCMVLYRMLMFSCLHSSVGPGRQGSAALGW